MKRRKPRSTRTDTRITYTTVFRSYLKFWDNCGAVLKEGLYEDFARRETLLGLARFKSTAGEGWRSLKDYVEAIKDNQTAIYYATGADLDRLASSPQLEGFRARGIEELGSASCRERGCQYV